MSATAGPLWRCLCTVLLLLMAPAISADERCSPPLCFASADERVTWEWGGRFRFDATDFHDNSDVGLRDGTNVRRARLSQDLAVGDRWTLDTTWEFADEGIEGLRDARLRFRPRPGLRYTLGHFKQPFGLERLTSARDLGYMERSLASELTPNRGLGGEIHGYNPHGSVALGIFGSQPTQDMDSRLGAATRVTFAPYSTEGKVLHLGAALAYRDLTGDGDVQFRQRPGSRTTDIRLVDSGVLQGRNVTYYGLEAAAAHGPLSVQADYIVTRVDRLGGDRNVHFNGWYVDLGWIITGELLPYDREDATFGRIRPADSVFAKGTGAVQLSLRLDSLDLNDADVEGGRQRNMTTSVTWYLTTWALLVAEYVKVLQTKGGDFDGARPSLIQGSVEIFF